MREVAWCELCAAEHLLDDGRPVAPLHEVCQLLEVAHHPPLGGRCRLRARGVADVAVVARGGRLGRRWTCRSAVRTDR
jgi:hypothetical protein